VLGVSAIALDPLIAEAKRRARRRRLWLFVALAIAAAVALTYDLLPAGPSGSTAGASPQVEGPRAPVWSVDDRDGMAVVYAPSGEWLSSTGGRTWRRLGLTGNVAQVQFVDRLHAFATTSRGGRVDFTRTADGGRTWLTQSSFPATRDASAMASFSTPRSGYLMLALHAGATLFRTGDGGKSWTRIARAPFQYGSIDLVRGRDMWVTGASLSEPGPGEGGTLYRSRDGGRTWHPVRLPHEDAVRSFDPFGSTLVVSANVRQGADLGVYVSRDGGAHWTLRTGGRSIPMGIAQFPFSTGSSNTWFAAWSHLFTTTDAGRHWRAVRHTNLRGYVFEIDFASPKAGWAIAGDRLMRTTDGGRHWVRSGPRLPKRRAHR
jgi:photosystem II stability/assembly factor-like uncharacterized protein